MGDRVEPSDVFLAFTVDQGLNVVNAIEALNVPVVVCNAHRLNTVVCWILGIAGSDKTCKNPVLEKNMKKLAACVGKFSHSAVNNSDLKTIQELSPAFSKVYELIRRMTPGNKSFNIQVPSSYECSREIRAIHWRYVRGGQLRLCSALFHFFT